MKAVCASAAAVGRGGWGVGGGRHRAVLHDHDAAAYVRKQTRGCVMQSAQRARERRGGGAKPVHITAVRQVLQPYNSQKLTA